MGVAAGWDMLIADAGFAVEGYWGPFVAMAMAAFIIWLIIRKDLGKPNN